MSTIAHDFAPRLRGAPLLLLCAVACGAPERAEQRASAPPEEPAALAPNSAVRDSILAQPFDARGYYFPEFPVLAGDFRLQFIDHAGTVSMQFQLQADHDSVIQVFCDERVFTQDTVRLRCVSDLLGTFAYHGRLRDPRGNFAMRDDIDPDSIAVRGDLVVGEQPRSLGLRYWVGH